jgi:excisionase family DNA binding protein
MPPSSSTLLLTVEEAAAELRIARRRIFEMCADGTLPSLKIGKSRRISRAALEEYVKGMEKRPAAAGAVA